MRGITEERLKEVFSKLYWSTNDDKELFTALLSECTELNAWQPIDENTPHDKWLLVSDAANDIYIGRFASQYGRWYVDISINIAPTHYQELPEAPK